MSVTHTYGIKKDFLVRSNLGASAQPSDVQERLGRSSRLCRTGVDELELREDEFWDVLSHLGDHPENFVLGPIPPKPAGAPAKPLETVGAGGYSPAEKPEAVGSEPETFGKGGVESEESDSDRTSQATPRRSRRSKRKQG